MSNIYMMLGGMRLESLLLEKLIQEDLDFWNLLLNIASL